MIFFPLTSYWFYLASCACRIVMHTFFQLFLSNATKSTSFAIRKQDFSIRYHNVKFLFDRHKNVIMRSEFTFFAVFVQFQLTFNLLQSTQLAEISRLLTGENRRRFAIIQSEKSPVDQCFHFMHELIQREFDYFSWPICVQPCSIICCCFILSNSIACELAWSAESLENWLSCQQLSSQPVIYVWSWLVMPLNINSRTNILIILLWPMKGCFS